MKHFSLESLLLLSHLERKARRIVFHPVATVIRGENDTGKSSIIKSIFRCLGAEPAITHEKWKKADVYSLLHFTLNGRQYSAFQRGRFWAFFDGQHRLLFSTTSVTNGLAPYSGQLFDFHLQMLDHEHQRLTPPPAYMLIPFYLDQDKGWNESWASFGPLAQIPNWRRDVAEYHAGVRSNEYYQTKVHLAEAQLEFEAPESRRRVLHGLLDDAEKRLASINFDIDVEAYKAEIDKLLEYCKSLQEREIKYREGVVELENVRATVAAQMEIVRRVEAEVTADYQYAVESLPDNVDCPTCGATYSNEFASRFALAQDQDRCGELKLELQVKLGTISKQLAERRKILDRTSAELAQVTSLLDAKQGDVTLQTLIENQGKREFKKALERELEAIAAIIAKLTAKIESLREDLARLDDRARRREIQDDYITTMRRYLDRLEVRNLPEKQFERLDSKIRETGSDFPRAILAYTMAMLQMKAKHGSGTFFPVVIDSPNQQDQDVKNLVNVLEFVKTALPKGAQLILGLVNTQGVDFGGRTIEFTEKYGALSSTEYDDVRDELRPYVDQL